VTKSQHAYRCSDPHGESGGETQRSRTRGRSAGVANYDHRVETDGSSNASTLAALERALEAAGVEFLPDNGVRLKVIQLGTPARSAPGGSAKPARAEAAPRAKKPPAEPKAKPAPSSKLDQIRALREQGAR